MSLFAQTHDVSTVLDAFPLAQSVRELLFAHGFVSLCKIGEGEHFARRGRRVILVWRGDSPALVRPLGLVYATLVKVGDAWSLALD